MRRPPNGVSASLTALSTQADAAAVPASPTPFAPSWVSSCRRLDMGDHDVGHLHGHRNEVVGERAIDELASLAVEAFLEEGGAEPLHDAAADLLVHQQRIDDAAAILDDPNASAS